MCLVENGKPDIAKKALRLALYSLYLVNNGSVKSTAKRVFI